MCVFDIPPYIEEVLIWLCVCLFGYWLGALLTRDNERQRERREANRAFRKAFLSDQCIFKTTTKGIVRPLIWQDWITEVYTRHTNAMCEYSCFLSKRKNGRIEAAVKKYHDYIDSNNLESWFNSKGHFKEDKETQKMKDETFKLIDKILSFAKE